MARIDTLTNFLTDVADSIRSKTGKSDAIACEDFDTEIESISGGGADISEYLDNVIPPSEEWEGTYWAETKLLIKKLPEDITLSSTVNNFDDVFSGWGLTEIPLLDTSNITSMEHAFSCPNLTTMPALNTRNVVNMQGAFSNCPLLSNESLNNILSMCINATSVTHSKTLSYIGLSEEQSTICEGLSNYQDFLDAGWGTGY